MPQIWTSNDVKDVYKLITGLSEYVKNAVLYTQKRDREAFEQIFFLLEFSRGLIYFSFNRNSNNPFNLAHHLQYALNRLKISQAGTRLGQNHKTQPPRKLTLPTSINTSTAYDIEIRETDQTFTIEEFSPKLGKILEILKVVIEYDDDEMAQDPYDALITILQVIFEIINKIHERKFNKSSRIDTIHLQILALNFSDSTQMDPLEFEIHLN